MLMNILCDNQALGVLVIVAITLIVVLLLLFCIRSLKKYNETEKNDVRTDIVNSGHMNNSGNTTINNVTNQNFYGGKLQVAVNPTQGISYSAETKREQDKQTIKLLFTYFSTNAMDKFLREDPTYIDAEVIDISDYWESIIKAGSFCLYDDKMRVSIMKFFNALNSLVHEGAIYYGPSNQPSRYKFFGLEHDIFQTRGQESKYYEFVKRKQQLVPIYKEMLTLCKKKYSYNLRELSFAFDQQYFQQ